MRTNRRRPCVLCENCQKRNCSQILLLQFQIVLLFSKIKHLMFIIYSLSSKFMFLFNVEHVGCLENSISFPHCVPQNTSTWKNQYKLCFGRGRVPRSSIQEKLLTPSQSSIMYLSLFRVLTHSQETSLTQHFQTYLSPKLFWGEGTAQLLISYRTSVKETLS